MRVLTQGSASPVASIGNQLLGVLNSNIAPDAVPIPAEWVKKRSGQIKCKSCGTMFSNTEQLRGEHEHNSHGIKEPFSCTLDPCQLTFSWHKDLRTHRRKIHSMKKPYICCECDWQGAYPGIIEEHMRTKHVKERSFPCTICDKKFFSKTLLRSHRKLHASAHGCTECSKTLVSASALRVHMRIHTGEKPYKCSCMTSFSQLGNLNAHLKKSPGHNRIEC